MRVGSAQRGFTLIEMMIGLAILAITIMLGVPSYTAWIMNTQIRNAAESVLNGMQLARNEAVRRNASVQLALDTQSSWTISVPSTAEQIQSRTYGAGSNQCDRDGGARQRDQDYLQFPGQSGRQRGRERIHHPA